MSTYTGTLRYVGFRRPWILIDAAGTEINLYPAFDNVFQRLHGGMGYTKRLLDTFMLKEGGKSGQLFLRDTERPHILSLRRNDPFNFSNFSAHIDDALGDFSGRKVRVDLTDGVWIKAIDRKSVQCIQTDGTWGTIPKSKEKTLCGAGTPQQCIFYSSWGADSSRPPQCGKFYTHGRRDLWSAVEKRGSLEEAYIGSCAMAPGERTQREKIPAAA